VDVERVNFFKLSSKEKETSRGASGFGSTGR